MDLCIATAIAMGITASAPFNGVEDENLAIAYISTLILVFLVRFFLPKVAVSVELTLFRSHCSLLAAFSLLPKTSRARMLDQKNFGNECTFDGAGWLQK